MDKDNLYLNILAETFADRSTNSSDEEKQKVFHFKSFIQIMTTLREIIEKQDEISDEIENIVKNQNSFKSEVEKIQHVHEKINEISDNQNESRTDLLKIQEINKEIEELNKTFANIYLKKLSWEKTKVWISAFVAAMGIIFSAMAWLNQMGLFSIVWNAKK